MNFNEYLDNAWTEHATDSKKVATGFDTALDLLTEDGQVAQFGHLITHVMGEHLGEWDRGSMLLNKIKSARKFPLSQASLEGLNRFQAILELGGKKISSPSNFSMSDQIRIYAVTASALAGQNQLDRGIEYFQKSLNLVNSDLPKQDPAFRSLAVTGNNLACTLEEKSQRTSQEVELMILASKTARKYWEIAGTWREVSMAEYRLSMTFIQAGDLAKALQHAQLCIEICIENKAGAYDMYYGYEALANVEKLRKNNVGFEKALEQAQKFYSELSEDEKKGCQASLERLKK